MAGDPLGEGAAAILWASLLALDVLVVLALGASGVLEGVWQGIPLAVLAVSGASAFLLVRGPGPALEPALAAVPVLAAAVGVVQAVQAVGRGWLRALATLGVAALLANLLGFWTLYRARDPGPKPNR